jgi:hypothetical protein
VDPLLVCRNLTLVGFVFGGCRGGSVAQLTDNQARVASRELWPLSAVPLSGLWPCCCAWCWSLTLLLVAWLSSSHSLLINCYREWEISGTGHWVVGGSLGVRPVSRVCGEAHVRGVYPHPKPPSLQRPTRGTGLSAEIGTPRTGCCTLTIVNTVLTVPNYRAERWRLSPEVPNR